ncbi:MAG: hypothetical protein ACI9R3_000129 [Verrucomicrobiales bacterium]|jgi:hypothetical protein
MMPTTRSTFPMHGRRPLMLMLLVVAIATIFQSARGEVPSSSLETFGYDRSHEGIARCLADMVWTPEREAAFEQSLMLLDADDFVLRDQAMAALISMAALPHQRLLSESESPNNSAEKRRRIYEVLDRNTAVRRELLLYLVSTAIISEGHQGLATGLLHAANSVPVTQRSVWDAVRTAIFRTVQKEDAEVLRSGISLDEATARLIACEGLVAIEGAKALPSLRPLLSDPDPRVKFQAALAFRDLRSDECLSAFISLLDTTLPDAYQKHDTHIRFNSVEILKKLTGQRFGYRAGFSPEVRRPYIEQWQAWLNEKAATTTLHFGGT